MMNTTEGRPAWAGMVLKAIDDACLYGHGEGRLTPRERELLRAVAYRLKGRLGENDLGTTVTLDTLGTEMIWSAAESIRKNPADA